MSAWRDLAFRFAIRTLAKFIPKRKYAVAYEPGSAALPPRPAGLCPRRRTHAAKGRRRGQRPPPLTKNVSRGCACAPRAQIPRRATHAGNQRYNSTKCRHPCQKKFGLL
jgi:hypothetical protein